MVPKNKDIILLDLITLKSSFEKIKSFEIYKMYFILQQT